MDDELRLLAADFSDAADDAMRMVGVVVKKGAYDIQAHAQVLVPVDTGATQGSIGVEMNTTASRASAIIGPTTNYAPHLEYGTIHQEPQPFMGPAADRVLPSVEEAMLQLGGNIL